MTQEMNTNYDPDPYDDDEVLGGINPVLVKVVGTPTKAEAATYGACQLVTVPQAGSAIPVQLLLRRPTRDEAYISNSQVVAETQSLSVYNTVTDPGAFATVASLASVPAGTYTITVLPSLAGTLTAADQNNMRLSIAGVLNQVLIVNPVAGPSPAQTFTVTLAATTSINVQSVAAASGAAAVYQALVTATPNPDPILGNPIIVAERIDKLQLTIPQGFQINPGQVQKFISQQPLYAVAIGGNQNISVLDQSWEAVSDDRNP